MALHCGSASADKETMKTAWSFPHALLILIGLQAWGAAMACEYRRPATPVKRSPAQVESQLDWWSVTDQQIRTAYCRRAAPFSDAEMKAWIQSTPQAPSIPEDKVELRLLFMKMKFGYDGSSAREPDNSRPWTTEELDDVLMGLSDYPDAVVPFEKNSPLLHYPQGRSLLEGSIATAHMYFSDKWNNESSARRAAAVFHEIAHRFSSKKGDIQGSKAWQDLSGGWAGKKPGNPLQMISIYGTTDSGEDFAESVTAYRYAPEVFQLRGLQEKYEYIKEYVFQGLEFKSADQCWNTTLVDQEKKLFKSLAEFAQWSEIYQREYKYTTADFESFLNFCDDVILREIEGNQGLDCIKRVVKNRLYSKATAAFVQVKQVDSPNIFKARVKMNQRAFDQFTVSSYQVDRVQSYVKRLLIESLVKDVSKSGPPIRWDGDCKAWSVAAVNSVNDGKSSTKKYFNTSGFPIGSREYQNILKSFFMKVCEKAEYKFKTKSSKVYEELLRQIITDLKQI